MWELVVPLLFVLDTNICFFLLFSIIKLLFTIRLTFSTGKLLLLNLAKAGDSSSSLLDSRYCAAVLVQQPTLCFFSIHTDAGYQHLLLLPALTHGVVVDQHQFNLVWWRNILLAIDNLFFLLVIHFVFFSWQLTSTPLSIHHVAGGQQQVQHLFTTTVFT